MNLQIYDHSDRQHGELFVLESPKKNLNTHLLYLREICLLFLVNISIYKWLSMFCKFPSNIKMNTSQYPLKKKN